MYKPNPVLKMGVLKLVILFLNKLYFHAFYKSSNKKTQLKLVEYLKRHNSVHFPSYYEQIPTVPTYLLPIHCFVAYLKK